MLVKFAGKQDAATKTALLRLCNERAKYVLLLYNSVTKDKRGEEKEKIA